MIKTLVPIIASLILFTACNKEDKDPEQTLDYIIFGHFYGFCAGEECVEIFKLTKFELLEDDSDQYPSYQKAYEGNFNKLEDSKYQLVKFLAENIPTELLSEQDTVIGSPDAADGGGIYFAVTNNNVTRYWLIDQMDYNIPDYLHVFKEEINKSIPMIQD